MSHEPVQCEVWRSFGAAIGFRVIAPVTVSIGGGPVTFTALLPEFGGAAGIIVEPDWRVLEPIVEALIALGYGYSCVSVADCSSTEMHDLLTDWGWNGPDGDAPDRLIR